MSESPQKYRDKDVLQLFAPKIGQGKYMESQGKQNPPLLDSQSTQLQSLRESIRSQRLDLSRMSLERDQAISEANKLGRELERLQIQYNDAEKKIKFLQDQILTQDQEYQKKHQLQQQHYEFLKQQCIDRFIVNQKIDQHSFETQKKQTLEDEKHLKIKLQVLQDQLDSEKSGNQLEYYRLQNDYESQIKRITYEFESKISQLQQNYQQQINLLLSKNEEIKEFYEQKVHELLQELQNKKMEIEDLKGQSKVKFEMQFQNIKQQKLDLENQMKLLVGQNKEFEQNLISLQQNYDSKVQILNDRQSEIQFLKNELCQQELKKQDLEKLLGLEKQTLEKKTRELQQLKATLDVQKQKIIELEETSKQNLAEFQIQSLKEQQTLKSKYEQIEHQFEIQQNSAKQFKLDAEKQILMLNQNYQQQEQMIIKLQADNSSLNQQIIGLSRRAEQYQNDSNKIIKDWNQKYQQQKNQSDALIIDLQDQAETLQKTIENLVSDNKKLSNQLLISSQQFELLKQKFNDEDEQWQHRFQILKNENSQQLEGEKEILHQSYNSQLKKLKGEYEIRWNQLFQKYSELEALYDQEKRRCLEFEDQEKSLQDIINELQNEISKYKKDFRDTNQKFMMEKSSWQNEIEEQKLEYENQLTEYKAQIIQLQGSVVILESAKQKMCEEAKVLNQKIIDIQNDQINELQSLKDEYAQERNAVDNQLQQQKKVKMDLETKLSAVLIKLKFAEEELINEKSHNATHASEISDYQQQLNKAMFDLQKLQKDLKEQAQKFKFEKTNYDEMIADISAENEKSKSEAKMLEMTNKQLHQQIDQISQKCQEDDKNLKLKIKELEEQLAQTQQSLENEKLIVMQSEQQIGQQKKQKVEIEGKYQNLLSRFHEIEQELQKSNLKCSQIENSLISSQQSIQNFELQISQSRKVKTDLEAKVQLLNQQNLTFQETINELEIKIQDLSELNSEAAKKLQKQAQEHTNLVVLYKETEAKFRGLQDDSESEIQRLQSLLLDLDQKFKINNQQKGVLESQINDLQQQIKIKDDEVREVQYQLTIVTTEVQTLQKFQIDSKDIELRYKMENDVLEEQITQLRAKIETLEKDLEYRENEFKRLNAQQLLRVRQLEDWKNQNEKQTVPQEDYNRLRADNDQLKNQYHELEKEALRNKFELTKQKREIDMLNEKMQQEVQAKQQEIDGLCEMLKQRKTNIDKQSQDTDALRSQNNKLQSQVKQLQGETMLFQKESEELKEQIIDQNNQIANLKKQVKYQEDRYNLKVKEFMEKNGDLDRMKNKYEEALNAGVNKSYVQRQSYVTSNLLNTNEILKNQAGLKFDSNKLDVNFQQTLGGRMISSIHETQQ